tara:strand:+ start:1541 stop:2044 length:504 start_codon:yes stop_codon:yes gene_type:complete
MDNKKLGFLILGIAAVVSVVIFSFMGSLRAQGTTLNCNPSNECKQVQSMLGLSHVAIGLISFITALGFYLLFFSKGEEAILKRLEDEKNIQVNQNKFEIILKTLDENEKKVLHAVKEQDGITQSTLKFRTDMSKSKLSQILTDFEKKNLIKRIEKGKTYGVHLIENF